MSRLIYCIAALMFGLATITLNAQSGDAQGEGTLNGIWTTSQNLTNDFLNHTNFNGLYGIDTKAGLLWDGGVGGPFAITRVQRTGDGSLIVTFWFDRGGFEAAYLFRLSSGGTRMTMKILKGLEVSSDSYWYKIPGSENRIAKDKATFDPSYGIVNDNRVLLRKGPGKRDPVLRFLSKDEKVTFIEKGANRETLGDMSAYWYEIKCSDNVIGWVYGQYLDLGKKTRYN